MITIVLLYVGAVLFCNGIWLLGKISDQEIAAANVFAGGTICIIAIIAMTIGGLRDDYASIVLSAEILLFAFTYLWVAYNQYAKADGRGLGWYCLFVALTAAPTCALTLIDTGGNAWVTWLGIDWGAWAVLWFMYWGLLAQQWPIGKVTGYVTVLEGIFTAWLPAYLLIMGYLTLPG